LITVGTVGGLFPLGGDNVNFRPFYIGKNSIAASNGTITVSHTDATSATTVAFTDNTIPVAGTINIVRRHDSFWTVAKSAAMTAGTFNIRAGGEGYVITAVNQTRLTRANDATNIGTAVASGGTPANVVANRTGLTAAQLNNTFYLASTNAVATPLPIELAYFHAEVVGDEVISTWKTLQEKNNHFFTVEKTADFERYVDVGTIDGQGNSQEEHTYNFTDLSPYTGKSYYRLKQTDFDGNVSFSDPVMIEFNGVTSPILKAYPNPSNGKQITLELMGLKNINTVPVQIYNQQGQKVMELILLENHPGIIREEIVFPASLPQGLYIIKAGRTLQLTRKIVIN
jgi:hypothetical protein